MDGVLLLNKPVGLTSHDVVAQVRRSFQTRQVGHCGTLDPFATGLLLVTLGKATKISRFLEAERKTYRATLRLGIATTTLDCDGEIRETKAVPPLTQSLIETVMRSMIGEQLQIPPMYSAIKINGKKLYELARKGQEIVREPRQINIENMELIAFQDNIVEFRVVCSRGTYVRVLASDLAQALGTVGHLQGLEREAIGSWQVDQAYSLDQLSPQLPLKTIREALVSMPQIGLVDTELQMARHGRPFPLDCQASFVLLYDYQTEEPVAIYERNENQYRCLRGI